MQFVRLSAALVLLGLAAPAHAEPHWKEVIGADLVETREGKWVIETFEICKIGSDGDKSLQMRSYAEVPEDAGVSRDFLVAFTASLETMVRLVLTGATKKKGGPDCDPIDNPIGKVDMELNLYMTAEGFQYEVVLTGKEDNTVRESKRWADVFPD